MSLEQKMRFQGIPHSAGKTSGFVRIVNGKIIFPNKNNDSMSAEDGGPGSGNWGHKGRPGKVGGSGKGGGKQYRGGRADIAYVGSRKDWLNGLSGEEQAEAQKLVNKMQSKITAAKKIRSMWSSGALSAGEMEEALKKGGLEKVDTDATVEENILENTERFKRVELIGLAEKARDWEKHKERLINENLSEDEKKAFTYLENNFYSLKKDGYLDCMDMLKAKALGLTEKSHEIPEELQYDAGIKERPATTWIGKLAKEDAYNLAGELQVASGEQITEEQFRKGETVSELEEKAFEKELGDTISYSVDRALKSYLKQKFEAFGGEKWLRSGEGTRNLSEDEIKDLRELINYASNYGDTLFGTLDYYNRLKRIKMMAIINKAMGGPDCVEAVEDKIFEHEKAIEKENEERKKLAEELKKKQEEEKKTETAKLTKFKEEREKREKAYRDAANSEQVADAMRNSGMFGNYSHVSLGKTDLKCAQEVAKSFENVFSRYPFLVGNLSGLDEAETGNDHAYASCSMWAGGRVHLNSDNVNFGNFERVMKSYESSVKSGFHPAGTNGMSIAVHELGHALDGFLSSKGVNGSRIFSTDARSFSGILRRSVLKSLKMTKASVEREVSGYATKNAWEWFAECFAEGMTSENPRPMAKEMMRQLDEILQKEGLING